MRDFESRDRPIVGARVPSFSFKPTEEPPSIEIASAFPPDRCLPSRMTYEFKELESISRERERTEKFNVTSNLIYSSFKEVETDFKV